MTAELQNLPVRTLGHSEHSKPPEHHYKHVSKLTLAFLNQLFQKHRHGSQVSVAAVQLQVI